MIINWRKSVILRVLGIILFGLVMYIHAYINCYFNAIPGACYLSPDAWFYLPVISAIPAAIIQLSSFLIIRRITIPLAKKYLIYACIHAIVSFIFIRFWLLITGQQWFYLPSLPDDLFIFLPGAIMGLFICWGSNLTFKLGLPKLIP